MKWVFPYRVKNHLGSLLLRNERDELELDVDKCTVVPWEYLPTPAPNAYGGPHVGYGGGLVLSIKHLPPCPALQAALLLGWDGR